MFKIIARKLMMDYKKDISSTSNDIANDLVSSIVNPFERIGYSE
jgi:hypothetical protein